MHLLAELYDWSAKIHDRFIFLERTLLILAIKVSIETSFLIPQQYLQLYAASMNTFARKLH